jgi:membrane protein YdbS with pleckstrin-like domain
MSQTKFDIVDYVDKKLSIFKISHPRSLTKMIEKNGLLIISMATASLYWYFDSLNTYKIFARLYTVFLFLSYGVFTQYLINRHKAMEVEIKELHQELKQRVAVFADHMNP